jgi:hypothetical protein
MEKVGIFFGIWNIFRTFGKLIVRPFRYYKSSNLVCFSKFWYFVSRKIWQPCIETRPLESVIFCACLSKLQPVLGRLLRLMYDGSPAPGFESESDGHSAYSLMHFPAQKVQRPRKCGVHTRQIWRRDAISDHDGAISNYVVLYVRHIYTVPQI